jgi:hypothetical protein
MNGWGVYRSGELVGWFATQEDATEWAQGFPPRQNVDVRQADVSESANTGDMSIAHQELLAAVRTFYANCDGNGVAPTVKETIEVAIQALAERIMFDHSPEGLLRIRHPEASLVSACWTEVQNQVWRLRREQRKHPLRIIRLS